jgi:DNA-binding XRE family transcriptional regulator
MAVKIGITRQGLSRIEKGIGNPKIETLMKIANVLNCTVDELYMEKEDQRIIPITEDVIVVVKK